MHMRVTLTDGIDRAVPLFGLNAPDTAGVLMITSRGSSDTTLVGILPFAPDGEVQADQSIVLHREPTGYAVAASVLAPEGGFIFDGMLLQDVQYLYVQGGSVIDPETEAPRPIHVDIDVSFIPNRVPVREV